MLKILGALKSVDKVVYVGSVHSEEDLESFFAERFPNFYEVRVPPGLKKDKPMGLDYPKFNCRMWLPSDNVQKDELYNLLIVAL